MYIGRNEVVLQMIAQASIGGNGQVYDPHPGNQTGGELNIKQWSSRPWKCVLRPKDPNMGIRLATLQRDACRNQNIGYDWARRTTYFSKLRAANWNPSAIRDKCDTDCSALTCANIAAVGHLMNNSQWASLGQLSTHYMRSALTSRGFLLLTESRYLTSDKYLLPGDVLLNDGKHTAVNLDAGSLSGSSVIVSNGDTMGTDGMGMMGGLLYYVENDEDDAIMREVGYIQSNGKSTLTTTPYKLSVINYTTALGAFFKGAIGVPGMMGGVDGTGIDVNVSGVHNTVAKQILQFCMSKGYNLAAACGVCGNVYAECGYNIAAVQKGASNPGLGICQWTYWSRKQAFLREVPDWKTNLTGQLNFMWKEVSTKYTRCHNKMLAIPNNEEGARQATIIWCDEYEAPGVPAKTKRIKEAVRLFKSSVIQM